MSRPKRQPTLDRQLQSALLDLHEPIAQVRSLAELVDCLSDSPDGVPPAVLAIVGRLLHQLDDELRTRYGAADELLRK